MSRFRIGDEVIVYPDPAIYRNRLRGETFVVERIEKNIYNDCGDIYFPYDSTLGEYEGSLRKLTKLDRVLK